MTSELGSVDVRSSRAASDSDAVLSFDNVSKEFPRPDGKGTLSVLDGVNFEVRPNQFTAIVGPSGCGKSTLLQLATGLDVPTSGVVRLRGEVVRGLNREIGYITQQANLFPWLTLFKNVELPLIVRDVDRDERAKRVAQYLELAGLTGFENHYPHQLSGGMQKRASIVRTLIYTPPLVVMDEPFGALDAQTRMIMHRDLLRLWEEQQQTVVFVTHDLQEAVTLADHIILLHRPPTGVKEQIPIDLPRPRDVFEPYSMDGYVDTYDRVWNVFRSEVLPDDHA